MRNWAENPEFIIPENQENFTSPESVEVITEYVYTLHDRNNPDDQEGIFTYRTLDPKINLDTIYTLYKGECLEKGEMPLSMESVSINSIKETNTEDKKAA